MADLSVFGKIQSLSDLQRQKNALAMKQRQMAMGNTPAAIQIAREIQRRVDAGDVEGARLLTETAKIYDKGIVPQFGQPGVVPERGGMAPEQVQQLNELYGQQPEVSFATRPGYNEQLAQRQALTRGAGRQAEQQVNLAYEPAIKRESTKMESEEKRIQERMGAYEEAGATLPQLEQSVKQLSALGKKATYTMAGRGMDTLRRETGQPVGDPAVARAQYISLVDNQILPLLRQTFGAQFTQKEGESLKATLGNPDLAPEEKDAVLQSFIEQKKLTLDTMGRSIRGVAKPVELTRQIIPATPQTGTPNYKSKYGLE